MRARELRELILACAVHLLARLALRTVRFRTFLRLNRLRLPATRRPFGMPELARIARRSRRVCGGSCLTESTVMKLLGRRHGHGERALTIGVLLANGRFEAHAWTGEGETRFAPLWGEELARPERPWLA